jgi:hypothetical protein
LSPDQTLVVIRERSYLDLLDLALVVVRRRPLVLAAWLALGAAPWVALDVWLLGLMEGSDSDFPRFIPWIYLLGMHAPWATAPLTIVIGGLMFGNRPTIGRVARTFIGGFAPMVLFQGLMRGALVVLWFLVPLLVGKFRFLNEVIFLERGDWGSIGGRAWALTRDKGAPMFGRWLFQMGATGLFMLAFAYAGSNLEELLVGQRTPGMDMTSVGRTLGELSLTGWAMQVGAWLAIGFFALVRFLEYIDQRTRLEGWEIELRMRVLGAALEDEERW